MKKTYYLLCMLCLFSLSVNAKNGIAYGPNLLTAHVLVNNGGKGLGLQYERIFGPQNQFSFSVPIAFCATTVPSHSSHLPNTGEDARATMFFFTPGIHWYPTGSDGVARYALGAVLIFGAGKGEGHVYINGTNQLQPRSIAGAGISNAINFQLGKHIRTGLELTLGICADDGYNFEGTQLDPFGQLSFHIGCRW